MANQADHYNRLAKVGMEGFALLEELDLNRRPKKSENRHQQPPQPHDFHQRAAYYNNFQHELHQPVDYMRGGPQIIRLKEPIIDCNQATQLYGGVVIVDHHSTRKPIPNDGY